MTAVDMKRMFVGERNFSQLRAKNKAVRKFDVLYALFGEASDDMFFPLLLLVGLPTVGMGAFLTSDSGNLLFLVAFAPMAVLLSKVVVKVYRQLLYFQVLDEAQNLANWLKVNFGFLVLPYELVDKKKMSIITRFHTEGTAKTQMLAQQDNYSFFYLGPNFIFLNKAKFSGQNPRIQEYSNTILALLEQLKSVDSNVEVNHVVDRVEYDYDQLVQHANAMVNIEASEIILSLQYLQTELEVAAETVEKLNKKALTVHNDYIRSRQDLLRLGKT